MKISEPLHRVAFLTSVAVALAGILYVLMSGMAQFAVTVNDVQMETPPAVMLAIGLGLLIVSGPAVYVLAGRWQAVRKEADSG